MISSNLGDSGFIVIRDNAVVHRSINNQHTFNQPYQLSIVPTKLQPKQLDTPNDSIVDTFQMRNGDIFILATDGLWDNVFEQDIIEFLRHIHRRLGDYNHDAYHLAKYAQILSNDPNYTSPFAKKARQNYVYHRGGKNDDITVIIGHVDQL
jgi:protein phosphatase PTC7